MGSVGHRWGTEKGKWNLIPQDAIDGSPIDARLSFRDENDGVVLLEIETFDDLHITPGVHGCPEDDLLKQVRCHEAGTREGDEIAAGTQQLQGNEVQVFVTTRCPFDLTLGLSQLGRVGDDHVKGALLGAQLAQQWRRL